MELQEGYEDIDEEDEGDLLCDRDVSEVLPNSNITLDDVGFK